MDVARERDARPRLATAGRWLAAAGLLVSARAAMEQGDPVYWSPTTPFDHAAAIATSVAWMVFAVALWRLWQAPPVRRGAMFHAVASGGFAMAAVGNLLEDVVDVDGAQWLFLVGIVAGALALVIAGVAALTVDAPLRWTGLLLILYVAGGIAPDKWGDFISGASLLALGGWLLVMEARASADTQLSS